MSPLTAPARATRPIHPNVQFRSIDQGNNNPCPFRSSVSSATPFLTASPGEEIFTSLSSR